jgi:hypothetical protein
MKIINTSGWHTPWLRRLIRWACRQLDYGAQRINLARFSQAHNGPYGGCAYLGRHTIHVKINPLASYPLAELHVRGLAELVLHDAVEALLLVTAHEIAHLERWDRFARQLCRDGRRDTELERDTEHLARGVLATFRARRAELLAGWGDAGPGPVPPAVIHTFRCTRCGMVERCARRPFGAAARGCGRCFGTWKAAAAADEFLVYERLAAQ